MYTKNFNFSPLLYTQETSETCRVVLNGTRCSTHWEQWKSRARQNPQTLQQCTQAEHYTIAKPKFYTPQTQNATEPYLVKTSYSAVFILMGKTTLLFTLIGFVFLVDSSLVLCVSVCEHDFTKHQETP